MAIKRSANFLYLLSGLLIILIAGPLVFESTDQQMPLISQLAFTAMLIVGIWSLMGNRRWFIAGIVLAAIDVVLTTYYLVNPLPVIVTIITLIELTFCVVSLVFAVEHLLIGDRMNLNRMLGAICIYLLLGLILSQLNTLIFTFIPDAFNGIDAAEAGHVTFSLLYYSFVTMTTLGYGDITPESPLARTLAYLAAISGQFYIAMLVGLMVGQYLNQANRAKTKEIESTLKSNQSN